MKLRSTKLFLALAALMFTSVTNAHAATTLTVVLDNSDLTISDDHKYSNSEAASMCKKSYFSYPYGERLSLVNEKNQTIGFGKVTKFVSGKLLGAVEVDGEWENNVYCAWSTTISITGKAKFVTMYLSGNRFGCQFYFDEIRKKKGKFTLDYSTDPFC